MRLISHPQAAVVFVGRYPQKPRFAHLLPHFVWELVAVVDGLRDIMADFPPGEFLRAFAEFFELVLGWGREVRGMFCGSVAEGLWGEGSEGERGAVEVKVGCLAEGLADGEAEGGEGWHGWGGGRGIIGMVEEDSRSDVSPAFPRCFPHNTVRLSG